MPSGGFPEHECQSKELPAHAGDSPKAQDWGLVAPAGCPQHQAAMPCTLPQGILGVVNIPSEHAVHVVTLIPEGGRQQALLQLSATQPSLSVCCVLVLCCAPTPSTCFTTLLSLTELLSQITTSFGGPNGFAVSFGFARPSRASAVSKP